MNAGKSLVRRGGLLFLLANFVVSGCATPAFSKIFQPPRKAPTHFSCGEDCPKSSRYVEHATHHEHHEHDGHQH